MQGELCMKLIANVRTLVLVSAVITLSSVLMLGQAATADAGALYKAKCAMCHGPDGAGKTPMGQKLNLRDLRSPEVQKQSDADLSQIVTKGKSKMPPFDGKLTGEQIKQLIAFIRDLAKK
jgi:mono/diheme cytochrome c family protein